MLRLNAVSEQQHERFLGTRGGDMIRSGISRTMKSAKPTAAQPSSHAAKTPDRKAIIRAVASSTAIETGQSIAQIERILRNKTHRFRHIALAR